MIRNSWRATESSAKLQQPTLFRLHSLPLGWRNPSVRHFWLLADTVLEIAAVTRGLPTLLKWLGRGTNCQIRGIAS